jgi:predicted esterase
MNEHHLHVRRTARFHTLGDPKAKDVWIACHGYAQLARYFLRPFAGIDDGSRYIVAPEALNRYYYETSPGVHTRDARIAATWMTREDREADIDDYVEYLDTLAAHLSAGTPRRITALGFSQGASTVSRWAARGRTRIDNVILWGSPLAPELDASATLLQGARLTIAIGNADEQIPAGELERQDARLRNAGMEYDLVRYAGGHRIEADALIDIASRTRDLPSARRE